MDCNDDEVLISKVPLKWVSAAIPREDEDGRWEDLRIFYDCPACGIETYVLVDKFGEWVQENIAAGTVPPDVLSGEVMLCNICEETAQVVN